MNKYAPGESGDGPLTLVKEVSDVSVAKETLGEEDVLGSVSEEYARALQDHLQGAGETALQKGYELGRRALKDGLGILEMVMIHHRGVLEVWSRRPSSTNRSHLIEAAETFFVESLTPFEMAYRGFRDANSALRQLNDRLEDEARRIAHTLHGEVGQLLACVHFALQGIASEAEPRLQERCKEVEEFLDRIEDQVRRLSHELRPTILDDLGLLPALEFLADGFSKRNGLFIRVEGATNGRLPTAVETALYRAAQEALNNVNRHARATRVQIGLQRQRGLIECWIRDNGVGFDVDAALARRGEKGLGLIAIRERLNAVGGTLEIYSFPGEGAELFIRVPLRD